MTEHTRPGCPAWCEADHNGGSMHFREVGRIRREAIEIEVSVRHDPDGFRLEPPAVMVSAWGAPARRAPGPPSVLLTPPWADDFADFMAVLGHADLAALVRQAAALIERPLP